MDSELVIDGKNLAFPDFGAVKFDGDRIPIPARFTQAGHFLGDDPIDCLLLVITPGRYRLIVQPSSLPALKRILDERERIMAPGDLLNGTQNNENSGIVARVMSTTVSRLGKTWRVTIPKEMKMLAPVGQQEDQFLFVLLVAGFLEFWFPETLRRAVSVPIADLLP